MSYYQDVTQDFQRLDLGGQGRSEQYSPPPGRRDYRGPQAEYDAAPPPYQPPQDRPPLPQGWAPVWDSGNRRWYYANEQTGQTQWEAPGGLPPRPPMQSPQGPGSPPYVGAPAYGAGGPSPYPPASPYGYGPSPGGPGAPLAPPPAGLPPPVGDEEEERGEQKKSSKGKMMLGAGLGVAAGVAAGAWLHHELHEDDKSSSDEEGPTTVVNINKTTNIEYVDGSGGQDSYGYAEEVSEERVAELDAREQYLDERERYDDEREQYEDRREAYEDQRVYTDYERDDSYDSSYRTTSYETTTYETTSYETTTYETTTYESTSYGDSYESTSYEESYDEY